MARIDAHAHVVPPGYLELLKLPDGRPFPLPPAPRDALFETMERFGIDAAVISTGPPGAFLGDAGRARELARAANEGLAGVVRAEPTRFAGLAVLPLPDVEASLAELAYALDTLGLDGVMLLTNVAGTYVGDPAWDPVFDELERRGAYVFLHPGFPPHALPLPSHPVWLYEFPFDTTRALTHLVYSGTLERCPSIRLQAAHLGGAAPFLAHRIASLEAREPQLATRAPQGAVTYLSRLWYDTGLANHGPALAATRELTSPDHIVFGTDWPYCAIPAEGDDITPDLSWLGVDERSRVEGTYVSALVPRLPAAHA
jgi:predicted TIM-barrel fold metal-dependent hydrolase